MEKTPNKWQYPKVTGNMPSIAWNANWMAFSEKKLAALPNQVYRVFQVFNTTKLLSSFDTIPGRNSIF